MMINLSLKGQLKPLSSYNYFDLQPSISKSLIYLSSNVPKRMQFHPIKNVQAES
jgi:hypothetical protein